MGFVDYELVEKIYNRTANELKTAEQIKKEVNEIISKSKLSPEPLTEHGAFMQWVEEHQIKDEYLTEFKRLKEVEKMEKAKQEVIQKMTNNAMEQVLIQTDRMDELLIEEQVVGAKPLVYKIPSKNGESYTLSWEGLTEAMLRQGNISVEDITFQKIEGKTIAKAVVVDLKRNIKMIGIAEAYQSEKFKLTTLGSKAVRNALRKVISNTIQQKVIKEAIEAKSYIAIRMTR